MDTIAKLKRVAYISNNRFRSFKNLKMLLLLEKRSRPMEKVVAFTLGDINL